MLLIAACLAAAACNSSGDRTATCGPLTGTAITAAHAAGPARLCGRLQIAADAAARDATGPIVLSWFRPDEQKRFRGGRLPPNDLLEALMERGRIVTGARLARGGVEYSLDYPGGDAVVLAIADLRHDFWATLFGGGAGNFVGVSAVGGARARTDVPLELVTEHDPGPPPERCQGARFELVKIDAPEVAGAIGNDTARRLCVWLPASYAAEPARRYPVVYILPGFASGDVAYLVGNRDLRKTADALAHDGAGEAILVGVDTATRHGSTYFTDSAAGGAWARFVRERMVPEIDHRYRTVATSAGRAVLGHSTGGFNAISLALRFPDLFGTAAASAPDPLDFEGWMLGPDGRVRPRWLAWTRLEAAVGGIGQMVSYAAAWSAEAPPSPRAYPFDLETGAVRAADWAAWRAQSPLRLLDDPDRVAAIRSNLDGRIFITVGKADEFGLFEPAQRFSARLAELGIAHELHATEGTHGGDQTAGLQAALTFAIRRR